MSSMILIQCRYNVGKASVHHELSLSLSLMRLFLAVLAVALLAGTADAQNMGGRGGKGRSSPENSEQQKAEQQKKKAVDDAYKAALGRIPDPQTKYDPWRSTR